MVLDCLKRITPTSRRSRDVMGTCYPSQRCVNVIPVPENGKADIVMRDKRPGMTVRSGRTYPRDVRSHSSHARPRQRR